MASDQQEQAVPKMPVTLSKYSNRVILKTILNRRDNGLGLVGDRVVIGGWVKSSKELRKEPLQTSDHVAAQDAPQGVTCSELIQSRIPFFRQIIKVFGGHTYGVRDKLTSITPKPPTPSVSILQLSDGSCVPSLQILVESSIVSPSQIMPTGTCILAEGILQQPSVQEKNIIELKADKILHVGIVDQNTYPLSKKRIPLDSLRDCAHFRPRTTTVASVMRIRNALTHATHTFFQNQGFLCVQVPVITTTDCEGSSETFRVTTLLGQKPMKEKPITDDTAGVSLESVRASIAEKSKLVEEFKRTDSNKEALVAALQDLHKTNELALQLEARDKSKSDHTYVKADTFKFSDDFFSQQTYLTVSGRLHLESYACALGNVYSFGPRFRAEKSDSKKFLAEMSMVELEMAFSQLEDAMNCADDLLKFLSTWVLEHCFGDIAFVSKRIDNTIVDRLQLLTSGSFVKISYAEAVDVLKQVTEKKFGVNIEKGTPLSEEHECNLADEIYKRPVIIYNYPKELKPFYVRLNDDGKTVAAFDVVVPKVGALIRGSQNEERLNMLNSRIKELSLPKDQYQWYLDLRRHGTAKHTGFSLVFDLLVLYATGLNDVRDAVPFPRSCGKAYN